MTELGLCFSIFQLRLSGKSGHRRTLRGARSDVCLCVSASGPSVHVERGTGVFSGRGRKHRKDREKSADAPLCAGHDSRSGMDVFPGEAAGFSV